MEANRILQEIGRPQNKEAVRLFFLNSITAECCEMAKQICISLDYNLNKIILEVRRALQVLDPVAGSNVRHSNTAGGTQEVHTDGGGDRARGTGFMEVCQPEGATGHMGEPPQEG